jgi:CRP/FNR family cyclic AMP-dependent transcriptional regulator
MNLVDRAFFLKMNPLFRSLELESLLAIADKTKVQLVAGEHSLFQEGEEAHHMYIIVEGSVQLQCQRSQKRKELSVHDFFGEEALLNQRSRAYSARSLEKTSLLPLSRTHLYEIMRQVPEVGIQLLQVYAETSSFRVN